MVILSVINGVSDHSWTLLSYFSYTNARFVIYNALILMLIFFVLLYSVYIYFWYLLISNKTLELFSFSPANCHPKQYPQKNICPTREETHAETHAGPQFREPSWEDMLIIRLESIQWKCFIASDDQMCTVGFVCRNHGEASLRLWTLSLHSPLHLQIRVQQQTCLIVFSEWLGRLHKARIKDELRTTYMT